MDVLAPQFNNSKMISLIVPFYNEEQTIDIFFPRIQALLKAIPDVAYEIVCINDGSRDLTLDGLLRHAALDRHIKVIDLSRNFGKEAALTAGIDIATGDAVIPFDADLQDPPEMIGRLVEKWREGFDVVIARRVERRSDSYAKRRSAYMFYRLHNAVADIRIPENAGDFRLMSRPIVEALKQLPENRRFMKGLFAWVGGRTAIVDYARQPRVAGSTKFSSWKLWNFALEGITSFSTLPLRIWTYVGGLTALFSLIYASLLVVRTLIQGVDVPGYASLITAVLFLGSMQLIGIGVIGEYIGRIYFEAKRRPSYIIRSIYDGSSVP